jgi:hypothetical protein
MKVALFNPRFVAAICLAVAGAAATAAPVAADQVQLSSTLSGANVVPGPGDPNGSGSAVLIVDTTHGQICYQLTVSGLSSSPTSAEIDQGQPGTGGTQVVPLTPPTSGNSSDCASVDPGLASTLAAHPDLYFVNVDTSDFPHGAVGGQVGSTSVNHADQTPPLHALPAADHSHGTSDPHNNGDSHNNGDQGHGTH